METGVYLTVPFIMRNGKAHTHKLSYSLSLSDKDTLG